MKTHPTTILELSGLRGAAALHAGEGNWKVDIPLLTTPFPSMSMSMTICFKTNRVEYENVELSFR
jgi:hypothetical protein